ncbi:MAG TPA: efflux RND transporter periplasmic adaptor subunit [Puia sp.]|nr:efflux RND transporter periplasmic adaptor subunit [Puia sp.]
MKQIQIFLKRPTAIILLLSMVAAMGCKDNASAVQTSETTTDPGYKLVKLQHASVSQVLKLPAQLAAYEEVSIFPKVNGFVKQVWVDVGSHVKKGQVLMNLEAPELEQAAVQAKEKYARATLDYAISKENYERLRQASLTPGAISPMGLASAKAKADADSTLCNAERANWDMERAILDYLKVSAPFDGVISERNVHPGALVSVAGKDKPMLDLRQTERLRLQVDVPENLASGLQDMDTVSFYLSAFPGKKMTGRVKRRSGVVNIQYRSERVELDIDNHDGRLAPGMYADVLFQSKGNPAAFAVPKAAVITSTERKYVLLVRNGKTVKVDVATGNETPGSIEITGDIEPGDELVVGAGDEMKEGVTVK